MGFIKKLRGHFHDDWCSQCLNQMDMVKKQLYAMPFVTVANFSFCKDADYYKRHLVKVSKKAEIPKGTYACGIHNYRCGHCGHRAARLTIFLPVRDQELVEGLLYFDKGELDDFDC